MPFQKGHTYGFTKGCAAGPGRPKYSEKEARKTLRTMMAETRIRRLTQEELEKAQKAAAILACTDFNYYKFLMDREEDYLEGELLEVNSLPAVLEAANHVMTMASKGKITLSKAKKVLETIKQAKDLHIEEAIEAAENIKKVRGS